MAARAGHVPGDVAVVFDRVEKRFGFREPPVLRGVSFALHPGSLVAVAGPNGSGKSTLLRLMGGIARPTAGRVVRDPTRAGHVGYVPERFPASLRFGTRDYLTRMARIGGVRDPTGQADELLERLGLDPEARRIDRLSKGTRQRVALAQALLGRPGLLLLDEPWTGLDAGVRPVAVRSVAERRAAGACVVVADHRWPSELVPDRVLVLRDRSVHDADDLAAAGLPHLSTSVIVELRPPGDVMPGAGGLGVPGLGDAEPGTDGLVRTVIDAHRVDAVLAAALATGWSVVRVEPDVDA